MHPAKARKGRDDLLVKKRYIKGGKDNDLRELFFKYIDILGFYTYLGFSLLISPI